MTTTFDMDEWLHLTGSLRLVPLAEVEPGADNGPAAGRTLEAVSHDGRRLYLAPEVDDGLAGYETVARHQAAGLWVRTPEPLSLRRYLTVHAFGHVLADLAEERHPGAWKAALEAGVEAGLDRLEDQVSGYATWNVEEALAELYVQATHAPEAAPWAVAAINTLRWVVAA